MNIFVKLYKLLKYSTKSNDISNLSSVKKDNINSIYKLVKKTYINSQSGGEHIDLSDCKEIYISNFHGKMIGETFKIPNNTWVIVPYGSGLINFVKKEEKEYFLQNRNKILQEFNKNSDKSIKLFDKNLLILKPGDSYCDIEIQIKFDNLIDEGLYEIEHAQQLIMDPFYRKINFGDIFANPLKENYLINFNIEPIHKEILRLYLSNIDYDFNINTLKNDPYAFKKYLKKEIKEKGDRMYKISRFSENESLVINNISRIMYPLLVNDTIDIVDKIHTDLIQQIKNFELPVNDYSPDYVNYSSIIMNFKEIWGTIEILYPTDNEQRYDKLISIIATISSVINRKIEEINEKNLAVKYSDNFNKFKKINEDLAKEIKTTLNYELIFDTIFQQNFDQSSSKKINLIDNLKTLIDNKFNYILTCNFENHITTVQIFDLMESLDVNVKSLVMALYHSTSFHLIFLKVLSVMSSISLELLKNYLTKGRPTYLTDIIKLINKRSERKKIIFSRSCQGFDSNVSIENAAKCLKHSTEFDLTNIFNQNNIEKLIQTVDYIKNNNLDNIFNDEIGDQDTDLYYDLICLINNKIKKSDVIVKIFIIYLKTNFIEIFNYFQSNMSLPINKEEKIDYFKYQFKIVLLMINLFIKSVYDKVDHFHKKNILELMNN